ncbi:MAG: NUDIX domain-containing protein [Rubrivivax sp.]|nr:NUDIX domain-containing protein [Rubrivivax sp.]
MDERWRPSVTVAAVIEHDGRFLLVEEHTPEGLKLNNPAGHLEPGETPLEAVVREALEETGREFVPEALLGVYMARFVRPARAGADDAQAARDITYLRFAYSGRVGEPLPGRTPDREIVRTLWLTRDEIAGEAARHRSPLLMRCIDDHQAGRRHALDLVRADASLRVPIVLEPEVAAPRGTIGCMQEEHPQAPQTPQTPQAPEPQVSQAHASQAHQVLAPRPARHAEPTLAETVAALAERFPALFTPAQPRPIKLRIQADIQQRAPGVFTKKQLSTFLHRHTTSTAYLRALVGSTQRFNLDGLPAGDLAPEHLEAARAELERRRQIVQERRARERGRPAGAGRPIADGPAAVQAEGQMQAPPPRRRRRSMRRVRATIDRARTARRAWISRRGVNGRRGHPGRAAMNARREVGRPIAEHAATADPGPARCAKGRHATSVAKSGGPGPSTLRQGRRARRRPRTCRACRRTRHGGNVRCCCAASKARR